MEGIPIDFSLISKQDLTHRNLYIMRFFKRAKNISELVRIGWLLV